MRGWNTNDSAELYGIPNWGREFLRINEKGNLEVAPTGTALFADLKELVDDLQARELGLPLLIRFPDILEQRIRTLAEAFGTALKEYEYQGNYRGVYPIKVNQQRHLVEDIVRISRPYHLGMEAGSKPELLVVHVRVPELVQWPAAYLSGQTRWPLLLKPLATYSPQLFPALATV
jgi:arginine decarboxylase